MILWKPDTHYFVLFGVPFSFGHVFQVYWKFGTSLSGGAISNSENSDGENLDG
jgi:hypothetical protein